MGMGAAMVAAAPSAPTANYAYRPGGVFPSPPLSAVGPTVDHRVGLSPYGGGIPYSTAPAMGFPPSAAPSGGGLAVYSGGGRVGVIGDADEDTSDDDDNDTDPDSDSDSDDSAPQQQLQVSTTTNSGNSIVSSYPRENRQIPAPPPSDYPTETRTLAHQNTRTGGRLSSSSSAALSLHSSSSRPPTASQAQSRIQPFASSRREPCDRMSFPQGSSVRGSDDGFDRERSLGLSAGGILGGGLFGALGRHMDQMFATALGGASSDDGRAGERRRRVFGEQMLIEGSRRAGRSARLPFL